MILNNTVAIIEAGIGAMSLGFVEAGFQIKEIFVKDRKAIEIHRKNIGGNGIIWIFAKLFWDIPGTECINCCVTGSAAHVADGVTLITQDQKQKIRSARYPAGCIGVQSERTAPEDEDDSAFALMQRLYQITGYQIRGEEGVYEESGMSAPVIP